MSMLVTATISGTFRKAQDYEINNIHTVGKLEVAGINLDVDSLKEKYPYLKSMKAQSLRKAVPQMLIGFNHFRLFAPRQILEDPTNGTNPSAYRSLLGWYVSNGSEGNFLHYAAENLDANLNRMMQHFFSTESFGVKASHNYQQSKEDKQAIKQLEENTIRKGEQFETSLLWKNENSVLPSSYDMAINRLHIMERKMRANLEFQQLCQRKFEEYLNKGYLKPVSKDDLSHSDKRWFLPWFFSFHPTKKPRLVFDAAAISKGKSLNDFLSKGPDLLRPLPAVLLRFRRHYIGITADISDMFHRVLLRDEDKPAQTVLYRADKEGTPEAYEMQVLFFGSASSPASAIYCKNRNASEFGTEFPKAVRATMLDFCMDDYCGGSETPDEAIELQQQLLQIHRKGGFPLVKWSSSSTDVLSKIPPEVRASTEIKFSELSEQNMEKTLGLYWDPNADEFGFKLNFHRVHPDIISGKAIPTKRQMCALLMSIFDPLGFVAHFKIKGLILLQHVWRAGIGWDDEIPHTLFILWKKFLDQIKEIGKLRVPRKLAPFSLYNGENNLQFHVLCDASEECFSASAYLRISNEEVVNVSFLFGKARVAPLKGLSIPRMELQAGLMGSRMLKTITDSYDEDLEVNSVSLWSDSRTFLSWLRSPTIRRNQFVGNRINEILDLTEVDWWRWVPSLDNVADDATRLKKTADLSSDSRWLRGPEFLYKDAQQWPVEDVILTDLEADKSEDKKEICHAIILQRLALPEISNFSNWMKLLGATAYIYIAIRKILDKSSSNNMTVEDLERAKKVWIKQIQRDQFQEEIDLLRSNQPIPRKSKLWPLSPMLDDEGVIVMKSRLENASVNMDVKYPPILDRRHKYVQLMVDWYHAKGAHVGQERTINELRKSCWIIGCREEVRSRMRKCLKCKLKVVQPTFPEMAPLPAARVEASQPPFYNCGVDYFGPYEIRLLRSTVKRWGVLFTCLSTRAVHLELAESLDTSAMLNVLSRFINLRGSPAQLWSDNGTNFVGANREIQLGLADMDKQKVTDFCTTRGMTWNFIPPASPHMGGSWERLVGVAKRILRNLLKEQHPKEDTLRTLLAEVTGIMNSRPITSASPDPEDPRCLTPNDLLQIRCVAGPTIPGVYDEKDVYRKSWRYAQKLALDFWKRWSVEYLPWLAKREKWLEKREPLREGDVVIVLEDNAPRNTWKKGVITKTFEGKDGQVRSVEVKIASVDPSDKKKRVKLSYLQRPVVKICPLSVRVDDESELSGRENIAEG